MEDVRQLVQEEGREARNLVAFHVAVDTPAAPAPRVSRKPPRARRVPPRTARRSASAGRDKRSELRARYWALLFGDLQRAIGEIYNTVEAHENLNECQEVILVLENYTRDFKALGEWFRLKWELDNTPPPQRPQSLAWEIRKTDFVRPESRRAYSVKSSPSVSGKNSPCLSGHNTPSGKNSPVTGKISPGSGKISPRISSCHATSPKGNIEFFSNKMSSKIVTKPEPRAAKEGSRLSDIKEKDVKENSEEPVCIKEGKELLKGDSKEETENKPKVEIGKAKESPNVVPKQVVVKSFNKQARTEPKPQIADQLTSQAKATISKLDEMENDFLAKHLLENQIKNDNMLNEDREVNNTPEKAPTQNSSERTDEKAATEKDSSSTESPVKSEDNFADVSNESSANASENKIEKETGQNKNQDKVTSAKIEENVNNEVKAISTEDTSVENVSQTPYEETKTENKETTQAKDDSQAKDDKKDTDNKKSENKLETKSNTDIKVPETKPSSRPAYSQAAAKPKQVTAKPDIKTLVKSAPPVVRCKTVVELPPAPKTRPFPKRNQTSKCSYPFNLTTGRKSLFDTTPSAVKVAAKKPVGRITPTGAGDAKAVQNKIDPKKHPPRPTNFNEKGDKIEKANPTLEKIKDCDEYSSSDTIVTQINMSRIESSDSLRTLVPEELLFQDVANSIEVLNVDGNKNDNEGWLTVKSRRLSRESKKQSKSHWVNRFHQPSATTSLPTLNIIESPKLDYNPVIKSPKNSKFDRAKSEQPEMMNKAAKVVKVTVKPKPEKTKDPAMIRQKSDVTGLKTRPSRNKINKKTEKAKDSIDDDGELTKNRLHSSLESLTTGLARSQESTEETFDFDKWKAEFKSTFKYFDDDDHIPDHNDILKSADPSERSEIAEMTSQIEENERKISLALDFQSEVDQRKLCEEEDLLNRQIMELQQVSDIDLDTETDDTETDPEILCEDTNVGVPSCTSPETLGALAASLEEQYETALAGMSWAERVDTLVVLESLVARDPGRAQQLHAKLSQGIKRRGSLQDALRRLQAKQARAERQRIEYQTERAKKIHQLLARVEEVKIAKNQLIEEKRLRMERRLQKAAENRDQHLKDIVRKAHDEEEKLREIAFIKQLEAENRRHEFLDQCRSHTSRLRIMRRDRLDKLEQKAAREAAVGARRLALERARRDRVQSLLAKRRERDDRTRQLQEARRQERDDAAREKAEGVKSRLSALAAAAELEADALRSRIRDKQDASQQRLDKHLQAIREKATGPRQTTISESQEQGSKEEKEQQNEANRLEQERREREKQKAVKKKARKVKQKLLVSSSETAVELTTPEPMTASNKMYKALLQLSNMLAPLLEDNKTTNNTNIDDENGKNKKKTKDKLVNGNTDNKNDGLKACSEELDKKKNDKVLEVSNTIANGIDNKDRAVENNNNTDIVITNEIKMENNRRKKKNKNNQEKNLPKLSKCSSVCSSLSDMSKTSVKSDRKVRVLSDANLLERQMNELYRIMDKFDQSRAPDKCVWAQKVHWLRALGQLLTVAAESDLAAQISPKSLTTGVTIITRLISSCTPSAAYVLTSNVAVHLVAVLGDLLDKDLQSDPKEADLAKQISDCLSVAFDSVLCSSRLYEQKRREGGEKTKEDELLTVLRGRVHLLISYFCLSGCVTRAEHAGETRENIQTLLNYCLDLSHPSELDIGTERASAIQSLRCALGTSICGARAEFCMLFAQDSDYQTDCGGFVRAARTAHLLRAVAEMDHHIVQEAFGEGGWPLEFRAAVARLLQQHAPNDREAPRTSTLINNNRRLDQRLSETMVMDLLVLVGFVVVGNPQLQETICEGWSVIKTICNLPANWLVSKPQCHALLPTLIALADRPATAAVIASELSMEMLDEYLESQDTYNVKLVNVIKQTRAKKNSGKK